MIRKLKWFIVNGGVVCLFSYVTLGDASVGAERVLKFIFILAGILSTIAGFAEGAKARIRAKGRSVPAAVSHSLGTVYVLWLVYLGFWVTALFALLNELMECVIHDDPDNKDSIK